MTNIVKAVLRSGALLFLSACAVSPGLAEPIPVALPHASYLGNFASDDDKRIFYFTLAQPGPVTLRTWSYAGGVNAAGTAIAAGGFDPTLSLFDSQGNFIVHNRDGGCPAVPRDPASSFCWDAFLNLTLPAGSYAVVLTQSENLPNGPTFADAFVYSGEGNFTTPPNAAPPGFLDLYSSKRTSAFAFDIAGAASVATTITSSPQLPFGITAQAYGPFTFTATSGAGNRLTWSIAGGTFPPGLSLNPSTGVVSGTAQSSGNFAFTVQVLTAFSL